MGEGDKVAPRGLYAAEEAPACYDAGGKESKGPPTRKEGSLTNRLTTGPKQRIAALRAAGWNRHQIAKDVGLSLSRVDVLLRLPVIRAESERLFMAWFMDLMNSRIGDAPPIPGVPNNVR